MAALDFPTSPAVGQIYAPSGASAYVWDGAAWAVITPGARNPQSAGIRNHFINGGFDVDQRGQAIASLVGSGWAADRWLLQSAGSNMSRTFGVFTPGQVAVPGEPTRFLNLNVQSVAGAANYVYMVQKLEGARALISNEPYTLSFYGTCNVAKSIGFEIQRAFGTGGSTADAFNCQKRFDLTTSFQRYTHTFTMPTLAGKTIGTSSYDDCLWCIFWLDAGANFNANACGIGNLTAGALSLANFQLEHGSVATPFEVLPPQRIRHLCERFYEGSVQSQVFPNLPGGSTGSYSFRQNFRTSKRVAPTYAATPSSQSNVGSSAIYGPGLDAGHNQVIANTVFTNISQNVTWTANSEL